MPGAIAETERMAAADPDVFLPRQFTNPDNAAAHELRTGPELLAAVQAAGATLDGFVAAVGTAGTLMGVGRVVRRVNPAAAVARVLVAGETVDAEQGGPACLGIPGVVDCLSGLLDEDELGGRPPLAVPAGRGDGRRPRADPPRVPGRPSSGLNLAGARRLAAALGPGHHVATVACDRMERYFSTDLFDDLREASTGFLHRRCNLGSLCTGHAGEGHDGRAAAPSRAATASTTTAARATVDDPATAAAIPVDRAGGDRRRGHGGPGVRGRARRVRRQLRRARRGRAPGSPSTSTASTVVDLWGGVADHATGAPYTEDTLQLVFSTTKGATARRAPTCWPSGASSTSTPRSPTYWPEFAPGRQGRHPGALAAVPPGRAALHRRAARRSSEALAWDPVVERARGAGAAVGAGHRHGYHAVTYGWLVGEVVRRVTGKAWASSSPRRSPARSASSSGSACPRSSRPGWRRSPTAACAGPPTATATARRRPRRPSAETLRAARPRLDARSRRSAAPRRRCSRRRRVQPARGPGRGAPRGQRRHQRPLARRACTRRTIGDGRRRADAARCSTPEQVAAASTRQTDGPDQVLFFETTFGLGFMTSSAFSPYGGPKGFGHAGAGGSVGFADPENGARLRLRDEPDDDQPVRRPPQPGLVEAVYDAIGVEPAFA